MNHYQRNFVQAIKASEDLLNAVRETQWDKVENLIQLRDKAADIAFPNNLPEELYDEARNAFKQIQDQQAVIIELSKKSQKAQKSETVGEKRGRRQIQSYLS